jgi:hypothetical protein
LFVNRILRVRYAQASPYLGFGNCEIKNVIGIVIDNRLQPPLQKVGLQMIAAIAHEFNASAEFAQRDHADVDAGLLLNGSLKKFLNPGVGLTVFAQLTDDVSVKQIRHGQCYLAPAQSLNRCQR